MVNRREFLNHALPAAAFPAVAQPGSGQEPRASVVAPAGLPVWNVVDFGAKADGATLSTDSIQRAVEAAAAKGGGVVYVPAGDYLTGTIRLLDNVTLHLEGGATLWGSKKLKDYDSVSLVYAADARNIAIRGRGTIDGNGTSFWPRNEQGRWFIPETDVRWRPDRMVQLVQCENVLLEGVTLRNSPAWAVHPIDCHGLNIRGVTILAGVYAEDGLNTDGIVPDGCSMVRISDCHLQTGDDAITFKIEEAPSRTCRDIVVTNCTLISSQHALKIGAGTLGDFRNIAISNCVIQDASSGIGVWMRDGGLVDGFLVDNVAMTLSTPETVTEVGDNPGLRQGGQPIYMWLGQEQLVPYQSSRSGQKERIEALVADPTRWGKIRNVTISNVTAIADGAVFISGAEEQHIEGVTLENIRIFMKGGKEKRYSADPGYPLLLNDGGRPVMWGTRIAPYDIFCRYVTDLKLRNVQLTWGPEEKAEWGSAIRCWHVKDLEIAGFVGRQALGSDAPVIQLKDVQGAFIHNSRPGKGAGTFLRLEAGSKDVSLMNNDLGQAERIAEIAPDVATGELFQSGNRPPRQPVDGAE